jgi:hypothetical protein
MPIPKIPKSTRINGERWRVLMRRQVVYEGEQCEGVCHPDRHVIEVSLGSNNEYHIMDTYYHEVLHAIVAGSGIELSDDQEHAIIVNAARWLAANCDIREKPRKPKKS